MNITTINCRNDQLMISNKVSDCARRIQSNFCLFRIVGHPIPRVGSLEHLIPHGFSPIASLPTANLRVEFSLRKKQFQGH